MLTIHAESAKPLIRELLALLRESKGEVDYTEYKRITKILFVKHARASHYEETTKFKNLVRKATSEEKLTEHVRKLHPLTIEILKYWNNKDSLVTHQLAMGIRYPACKSQQTKTVQTLDNIMRKLNKGVFYKQFKEDIREERFLNLTLKDNLTGVKLAIDNIALYYSAEYDGAEKKPPSINQFFVNLVNKIYDATLRTKFKHKYPFLYWLENPPVKKEDNRYSATAKDPVMTQYLIGMFNEQGLRLTPTQKSVIVDNANKVYDLVKSKLPQDKQLQNVLVNIPALLLDCMKAGKGVHPDNLYYTVNYSFEKYLRQRRYIV